MASERLVDETQALLEKFMSDPNDSANASDALIKAAALFEREELVFRGKCADVFSRERENYAVGDMLALVVRNENILSSLFTSIEQRRDAVLQTAAARFLVAAAPGLAILPSLQQSLFMELLTTESMEKRLFEWVDAAQLPMCVYAEGLLALALLDDQYADETVRRNTVPSLLRRLRGLVFEDKSIFTAPGAKAGGGAGEAAQGAGDGQAPQELTGLMLLEREKMYLVGCFSTLMSYKECLAVALQEGALDVILALLRCNDKVLVPSTLNPPLSTLNPPLSTLNPPLSTLHPRIILARLRCNDCNGAGAPPFQP